MSDLERLETVTAAIAAKVGAAFPLHALIRGLPERHLVQMSLREAAEFVLLRWSTDASETQLLPKSAIAFDPPTTRIDPKSTSTDKLREDLP